MQPGRAAEERGAEGAALRGRRRSSADGGAGEPLRSGRDSGGRKVGGTREEPGAPCRRDEGLGSGKAVPPPGDGCPPRDPRQKFLCPGSSRARRCRRERRESPGPAELRRTPRSHLGEPLPGLPPDVSAGRARPALSRAGCAARHRAVAAAEGARPRYRPRYRGEPRDGRGTPRGQAGSGAGQPGR